MINVPILKGQIKQAFQNAFAETADPDAAMDAAAQAIAQACAEAMKRGIDTAVISITAVPALVSPAGPVTGTVACTATITGTI